MPPPAALILAVVVLVPAPATAAPPTEFGPSETGCPGFWAGETPDPPPTYQGEYSVGPFGTTNLHVTGMGLETDGTALTATIRVLDMKRQVMAGFTRSGWTLGFAAPAGSPPPQYTMFAHYDLASDSFAFWARRPGAPPFATTGSVVPGPGGGLQVTVPLERMGLAEGTLATNLWVQAYAQVHYFYQAEPAGGASLFRSEVDGPPAVPIVRCPGASLEALELGGGSLTAYGWALPAEENQAVTLEVERDGEWVGIAEGLTDGQGAYSLDAGLAPGPARVRVRVETRLLGNGLSRTVEVAVT